MVNLHFIIDWPQVDFLQEGLSVHVDEVSAVLACSGINILSVMQGGEKWKHSNTKSDVKCPVYTDWITHAPEETCNSVDTVRQPVRHGVILNTAPLPFDPPCHVVPKRLPVESMMRPAIGLAPSPALPKACKVVSIPLGARMNTVP